MNDHRKVEIAGYVQLLQEIFALPFDIEFGQEIIQADLADGHGAMRFQPRDELLDMFRAMLVDVDRMHAVSGKGLGVIGAKFGNAWPGCLVDRRYHNVPYPCLMRTPEHGLAVGRKARIIDVRVAVGEFEHSIGHPEFGKMAGFGLSEHSVI